MPAAFRWIRSFVAERVKPSWNQTRGKSIVLTNETITTIAATIGSGVVGLALSQKTAIPSILFFLIFGVILGPDIAGWVNPGVFGDNFPHYISLMVSLILFEGGASLKLSQYRDISVVLRRLLFAGSAITLCLMAAAVHLLGGLPWKQAVLLGSVLIVTGPTVVIPILQRLRIRENVHNILKWESILIDPIGVVTAVVIFEFLIRESGSLTLGVIGFLGRFAVGAGMGMAGAWILEQLLTRRSLFRFEGEEMGSLIVVSGIILFYGLAEAVSSHAGLVTTAVIGVYLGNRSFAYKDHIMRFEQKITQFVLAALFVLLSSQIPLHLLAEVSRPGWVLLVLLILVARPVSVFFSAGKKSGLALNEKMFIALFAPRGIVSASLATLFSFSLTNLSDDGSRFLALSFFLIVGSILFYTLSGGLTARALGVREEAPSGIIIIGATPLSLAMGEELRRRGRRVQFIDTNPARCEEARENHFEAYEGSGFDFEFLEYLDLKGVAIMVAMTPSHEVNLLACQAFANLLGPTKVFRLWGAADTWENVTSPSYDQAMGRPLLVTGPAEPAPWLLDPKVTVEIALEPLTENVRVQTDTVAARGWSQPLFAWANSPVFVTPEANLPAGSELIFARKGSKARASRGGIARRAFEKVRRLYESS